MERENNIDRQSLAPFPAGGADGGFQLGDTHAAGRLHFGAEGGRPTRAMLARLAGAIPRWSKEAITYCIIAEGGDPFCLGWDMQALLDGDREEARQSLAESYALAWQLDCFTKPTIPLINGLVSGAGVAFTLYGTHRVAGPGYRFAVQGPQMGWFPDHGVTQVLAQLPGEMGTYLALTGAAIGPADAFQLGLVTQCIPAEAFPGIVARLADADPVDPILDGLHQAPGPGALGPLSGPIAQCFAADSIEVILDRLKAVTGSHAAWAAEAHAAIASAPRLATALTLRLLRENRHADLREALIRDYRVACRLLAQTGKAHATREVSSQTIGDLIAIMGAGDLHLATRVEMQAPVL